MSELLDMMFLINPESCETENTKFGKSTHGLIWIHIVGPKYVQFHGVRCHIHQKRRTKKEKKKNEVSKWILRSVKNPRLSYKLSIL